MTAPRRMARSLFDYRNPKSLGSRLRARRAGPLRALIEATHRDRGAVRILDMGGTRSYWNIFPRGELLALGVRITLLNLEPPGLLDDELFTALQGDACEVSAADYDVCHSNSVIEHVGDWARMKAFARQVRAARRYYVQTPNFWFPIEPHLMLPFIHWLPLPLRASLSMAVRMGDADAKAADVDEAIRRMEEFRLLDGKMLRHLFPDARCCREKLLFLTKSYMMVKG